jgi:ribose 5-phosphate isomerase A
VEVVQFGWEITSRHLQNICPGTATRRGSDQPLITDNGNFIIDCKFGPTISDPVALEAKIRSIAGVVEVGLFTNMADVVIIGSNAGTEVRIKPNGRLS